MIYIGMDIQKYISTAVVIDDNEKILEQRIDFKADNETLDEVIGRYPVDGTKILIENLTVAHHVYHHLVRREYDVLVIHTGNGCVPEIANSEYKSDLADARKLAVICKDIVTGRRTYRMTHIPSENEMKAKSLCRVLNDFSEQVTRINLQIQEYMNLWDLQLPKGLKSFTSKKALRHMSSLSDHPTLQKYADHMSYLQDEIKEIKVRLDDLYKDNEDFRIMKSIKGVSTHTAATLISSIDGIERFDTPEKLVSHFGLNLTRNSSGGVEGGRHITKQGDPIVRKLLANVVLHIVKCYPGSDIAEFYRRMKGRKVHWDAVTATMRKLTHAIWAMLTRKEPFRCAGVVA